MSTTKSTYKQFGHSRYSYELARDLLKFRDETAGTHPPDLSFWAVFEQSDDLSAAEFEKCLWKELSSAATHPEFASELELQFGADPESDYFYFMLDGTLFSVLGLHPHSAHPSRRFPHPTLIFTVQHSATVFPFQEIPQPSEQSAGEGFYALELSGREKSIEWKFPIA